MSSGRHRQGRAAHAAAPARGRTRRGLLAVAGVSVTAGTLMVLSAVDVSASADPATKVVICHATDSYKNPYVSVDVDVAGGWDGHDKHTGPVFSLDIPKHTDWGDIIPPTTYDGHDFSLNWDADGQAIWNNGCALPSVAPTVTATVTETATVTNTATETQTATETRTVTAPASTVTETVTATAPPVTETVTAPPSTVTETVTSSAPPVTETVTAPPSTVTETVTSTALVTETVSAPASTETVTETAPAVTETVTAPPTTETVTAPGSTETVTETVTAPAGTSAAASSSEGGTSAAASSQVAGESSSRAASSEAASTSDAAGVAAETAGPIPAGADAGRHAPVSRSGLTIWGSVLIFAGGLAGLFAGVRPRRSRAH